MCLPHADKVDEKTEGSQYEQGNSSVLNKVNNNKAVTTNQFDVLSTFNEEDASCKVNQVLEHEDSNDYVNKERFSAQAVEDKAYKSLVISNAEVTIKDWVEKTFGSDIQDEKIVDDIHKESNDEIVIMKNDDVTPVELVQSSLEDNMSMVEQVGDGKVIEKEVEALEEDMDINLYYEIRGAEIITSLKLNLGCEESHANVKHMGDHEEREVE
ncbi:hypothetical protein K7X08_016666 [Anisodus acutangulus]|uniref:Uncharacterized protein n=1 Tax=Anisodus acutangulus TaxID=402998 RepID=A0A9Q1LFM9_9SOLA|nr:hypothetical protein K7X08_016666 [Anisodus acutangulus]